MELSRRLSQLSGITGGKQQQPQTIPFGEWMPDRADFANPGATEANGVVPTIDGYAPLPDLSSEATALDARCQGAAAAQDTDGNPHIYAGDATKLYEISAGAPTDASKSGGYSIPADEQWEFELFGQTFMATNINDPVQSLTIGGATFADMITSTNKPKARHIAVVRDFVVLGNTVDDTDGAQPNRVWWSGIGDNTDFDPDADTQCDFNDFKSGGWVQKVVGNDNYGLVFLENQIRRMEYVGSPIVFDVDTVVDNKRGTPIPGSVIAYGRLVFFIAEEGFMMTDGVSVTPIGHRKVDKTFWNQFDSTYYGRVSASIFPLQKLVMWSFPGSGSAGSPNKIYCYNWAENRWSEADIAAQILFRTSTAGLTLDELDTITTDLDALPFPLDSRAWTGGNRKLGAFDSSNRMSAFTGSNIAATLETGEVQLFGGQEAVVKALRPLVDGGTITCAVAPRARQQDTATFGSAVSVETDGHAPFGSQQTKNMFHRFRTSIAAGGTWNHAQGVVVDAAPAGKF